jgi:hypothetical protein
VELGLGPSHRGTRCEAQSPNGYSGLDEVVPQHAHVLVLEVVAVVEKEAGMPIEAHADVYR